MESGAADEVIAAGVLHDALEKTDATAYDIYARFGRRVGDIVSAVSHCPLGIPGYARRKRALRDQAALAGDADALTVFAAADKPQRYAELRLGDGSAIKVRGRKLKHYRLSLAMLQERLPDSPLLLHWRPSWMRFQALDQSEPTRTEIPGSPDSSPTSA